MEIAKLEFKEIMTLAKIVFKKPQSITYERYKLFNRSQEPGKTLEAFHAELPAQASKYDLYTLEDELVRYLFISKKRNPVFQNT